MFIKCAMASDSDEDEGCDGQVGCITIGLKCYTGFG